MTSEYVPKNLGDASTPTVAFSELSKNSRRVAETLDQAQRVHITRRDGDDLYLTTARHDQQREETADITARLLAALVRSDAGERAVLRALPSVFPWVRHLSADELGQFAADLIDGLNRTSTPPSTAWSSNGARQHASSPIRNSPPSSPAPCGTRTTAR